jgi:hypothetical protein
LMRSHPRNPVVDSRLIDLAIALMRPVHRNCSSL